MLIPSVWITKYKKKMKTENLHKIIKGLLLQGCNEDKNTII